MLELDEGVVLALDVEAHAILEVCGADGCHLLPLFISSQPLMADNVTQKL
jgi:hypothetical protein